MAYKNAKDQAAQTSTAIMQRLTKNHFALTEGVANSLVAQGLPAETLPMLASTCLAVNIPPNIMRYTHNIPQVVRVFKLVTELGYRVNDDFYTSIFDSNVPVLDEDGNPTNEKAKAPTVVVMLSAGRAETNAKEDDKITGLMHHVEACIVEDETEARAAFDQAFSGSKSYKEVVVARADLYTYHRKSGQPIGSGKPQVFYGFYVPFYLYNGQVNPDRLEQSKPKDNYSIADVAKKRAITKAYRAVTRNNYARDDRPVDVRLASLMDSAQNRLATAERIADNFGVTIESAIIDGEEIAEQHEDKRATAMIAQKNDPFAALMMFDDDGGAIDGEAEAVEVREIVQEVLNAVDALFGDESEAHIAEQLERKGVGDVADLSDEDLYRWKAWLNKQADTQPA